MVTTSTPKFISAIVDTIIIKIETIAGVTEISVISDITTVIIIMVKSYFPTFTNQLCPTSPTIMRTHILFHSLPLCKTGRSSIHYMDEYLW
ncbi:hypothetical protein QWT69_05525 [Sporosarcina oncorhynchi]|uniref:Uncharacterized protein n=1 Tax=Sporosarcina oncorhynchi TaxID=3056444 RepID=A0ABZ0L8S1_9BACL|nr:hypothetical protein [Sporosarcina sp. T2O-4]WOV88574.1 hypothetical protein QWT69_05525 [Sporosarcina sp. T2O-4]